MAFLQVHSKENAIILNTPNRNEILKDGPPQHTKCDILGRGAYGTVFKAVFNGKQVAVKIVKNLKEINMQSMRNETHVLGWRQRNIVRILKIESTPNFGIVIMERFDGQCLQYILDAIELSVLHRIFIAMDVLAALYYCHRRQLLHLDVKPQNVLVAFNNVKPSVPPNRGLLSAPHRKYVCKLCDFGSSMMLNGAPQPAEDVNRGSATKGTVRYMSPEALRELPLTPAADIYSLGITMWQLQHRQLPYSGIECNEAVAYQVVKYNMRPDSDEALRVVGRPQPLQQIGDELQLHHNCMCENFSSEISHRSLDHIKHLLNQSEHHIVPPKMQTTRLRVPFRELSPQQHANVPRDLRSEFVATGCDARKHRIVVDFQLESIFAQSSTLLNAGNVERRRTYESLYRLCWHSDAQQRPSAKELRSRLEEIL